MLHDVGGLGLRLRLADDLIHPELHLRGLAGVCRQSVDGITVLPDGVAPAASRAGAASRKSLFLVLVLAQPRVLLPDAFQHGHSRHVLADAGLLLAALARRTAFPTNAYLLAARHISLFVDQVLVRIYVIFVLQLIVFYLVQVTLWGDSV